MNLERNINPTQSYIHDEVVLENGMVAQRYGILCTSIVAYEVWEPMERLTLDQPHHSTLTTINGKWYGSLTTRPLPPEIEALPAWIPGKFWPEERINAVQAFHADLEQQAEAIIRATFPQDFL